MMDKEEGFTIVKRQRSRGRGGKVQIPDNHDLLSYTPSMEPNKLMRCLAEERERLKSEGGEFLAKLLKVNIFQPLQSEPNASTKLNDHLQRLNIDAQHPTTHKTDKESVNSAPANSAPASVNSAPASVNSAPVSTSLTAADNSEEQQEPLHKCLRKIVCYGLGSPSSREISRPQLAFLLELQTLLQNIPIEVYDPVFQPNDIALFKELNIVVCEENEECYRTVTEPTLFYMPHCCWLMFQNLIRANWSYDALCNIIVLSNDFTSLHMVLPRITLTKELPYVFMLMELKIMHCIPFDKVLIDRRAFSSTAAFMVNKDTLPNRDDKVWRTNPKYVVQEIGYIPDELIRKNHTQTSVENS